MNFKLNFEFKKWKIRKIKLKIKPKKLNVIQFYRKLIALPIKEVFNNNLRSLEKQRKTI
jgi:hypothetical protein